MLTELEKLERARMYMDKLANGIDPITDAELPNDSALNNVRLSRCFFYVSDILRQVIEKGGLIRPAKSGPKADFVISAEKLRDFEFSKTPLKISDLVDRLNGEADLSTTKKLTTTVITNWLLAKGFLCEEMYNGKKRRLPTKEGGGIGILTDTVKGEYGEYKFVIYNEAAQRFLIDNLDAMLQAEGNTSAQP